MIIVKPSLDVPTIGNAGEIWYQFADSYLLVLSDNIAYPLHKMFLEQAAEIALSSRYDWTKVVKVIENNIIRQGQYLGIRATVEKVNSSSQKYKITEISLDISEHCKRVAWLQNLHLGDDVLLCGYWLEDRSKYATTKASISREKWQGKRLILDNGLEVNRDKGLINMTSFWGSGSDDWFDGQIWIEPT